MEEKSKTYTQMRNEFYGKFRNTCVPVLQELDSQRRLFMWIIIAEIVIFLAVSIPFCYEVISTGVDPGLLLLPFIFGVPIISISYYYMAKYFEINAKRRVMPILCKCFENLKWIENASANHSFIKESGLVESYYNRKKDDDIFMGSYKGVPFTINEVFYERVERTSKHRNSITVFDGVFITVNMNKEFNSHTVVCSDKLVKLIAVGGLRHTTLEDVVFEKKFDVFTNDEVEARYLLTPSFMEHLVDLKTIYKSDRISSAFYKNKFIIAIDTRRDMFKIGSLFTKAYDEKPYFQMYEEIISIIKLIDHFKLGQKIGL